MVLYENADTIIIGDILPDISHKPVSKVEVITNYVIVYFKDTTFHRVFRYGGKEYGFEVVRIERAL